MAATLHNNVYDYGLTTTFVTESTYGNIDLHLCSAAPTTYAEATSTYTLGSEATITISGPSDGDTSGRKVTIPAVVNASVTADGTATHIAVVNTDTSILVAVIPLDSSEAVLNGGLWSSNAVDIEIADPA